ncbi:MAG: hypothetical protein AAF125_12060, partial [Chloroflexota bacterium]
MTDFDTWVRHIFDHPLPPEVDEATKQAHYDAMAEAGRKLSVGEVTYDEVRDIMAPQPWYPWYQRTH